MNHEENYHMGDFDPLKERPESFNPPDLKNLIIKVLNETTELPQLGHAKNDPDNPGVYITGTNTTYLLASNTRSFEDVQQVLRHETFGHFAIDSLPVQERHSLINKLPPPILKNWKWFYGFYPV